MDFEEAKAQLSGSPPPSMSEHRSFFARLYSGAPQKAATVDLMLREIEERLAELAKHGHMFVLVKEPVPEPDRFPQMIYFTGPNGTLHQTVHSKVELDDALADGWRTTPNVPEGTKPESETESRTETEIEADREREAEDARHSPPPPLRPESPPQLEPEPSPDPLP